MINPNFRPAFKIEDLEENTTENQDRRRNILIVLMMFPSKPQKSTNRCSIRMFDDTSMATFHEIFHSYPIWISWIFHHTIAISIHITGKSQRFSLWFSLWSFQKLWAPFISIWGVSINGGIPPNGWFISWKIPSFEMDDDRGYPHGVSETSKFSWTCDTSCFFNIYETWCHHPIFGFLSYESMWVFP